MNRPCHAVEPSRLKLLLDDGLPGPERRRLESHLEACASCRDALEELAGEPGWWEDIRKFVPRDLAPSPSGPTEDHPPDDGADDGPRRSNPPKAGGDIWLDFLAPSDDHQALGRLGGYEVLGVLGRGGMGIVLKAFDPALDRMVALKVLSPALAASGAARHRFAREARAAAAVVHEHVVAIHAVSSWRGLPYLVMQYVPGRSLQDRIDRDGPLEIEEVLRIGMQAAAGLAAAHAHGLVHRDVKPSNILLEDGLERVKITDFGLARAVDDASLTQSGVLAGTPQYMAPEQAQGDGIDHRADLFSLGSVLYAMCAGRPPFRAETTVAVIRRVCDERPRPLREINPDVPAWLAAIIEKLHAKEPSRRFTSATELAEELSARLSQLYRPDDGPLPSRSRPAARSGAWWAVAAGILVVVVGVGGAEAGGLTALRAWMGTVFRIRTPEGTLVIDVDDPEVKVRVDDSDVVISGTGPQEFRFRPGPHQVVATRDGRPVLEKVVTIERGGKEIVAISREGTSTAAGPDGRPIGVARRDPRQPAGPPSMDVVPATPGPAPSTDALLLQERIRRLEDQLARMQTAPAIPGPPPAPAVPGAVGPAGRRRVAPRVHDPFRTPALPAAPGAGPGPEATPTPVPPFTPALPASPGAGPVPTTAPPYTPALPAGSAPEAAPVGIAPPTPAPPTEPAPEAAPVGIAPPTPAPPAEPGATPAPPATPTPLLEPGGPPAPAGAPSESPAAADPFARLLEVFPVNDGSPAFEYPNGAIRAVAYSPAIRDLALVCRDGSLSVWSRAPRGVRAEFLARPARVSLAAFSPDGRSVVACLETKDKDAQNVKLWDMAEYLEAGGGKPRLGWIVRSPSALAFSPDGKELAAASQGGSIQVFGLSDGRRRAEFKHHDGPVLALSFMPDSATLVSAGHDNRILFATVRSRAPGEPVPSITLDNPTNCLAISPDGEILVLSTSPPDTPPAGYQRDRLPPIDPTSRWIRLHRIGQDAKGDRILENSRQSILTVAFSPDGRALATGGRGDVHESVGEAKLWDVATGRLIAVLKGHRRPVTCLAFSPDGTTLVTAGGGDNGPGEVKLWDLRTVDEVRLRDRHAVERGEISR
jgi:hypothetical protein